MSDADFRKDMMRRYEAEKPAKEAEKSARVGGITKQLNKQIEQHYIERRDSASGMRRSGYTRNPATN